MDTPSPPLRIGIDARAATEVVAGRGRVVRELLRGLARRPDPHHYELFARERWQEPLDERFAWRLVDSADPWWHLRTAMLASRSCDVFLSSNSNLTVPLLRIPSVAIVYDLVAFDRSLGANRRSAVIEHLTLGPAVRRASGLACISQFTADELIGRYPSAAPKVSVAPLAASLSADRPAGEELEALPEPGFVLAVGTLEPRKNLPRLVAAYASLPPGVQSAHRLVVIGERGWQTGPTLAALNSLGDRCLALGRVSDAVLAELYRRCAVFCYPSLGEGFGLPVLEAMAAGAAVVTSNVSSLPEVGGDAVTYVEPLSVPSITSALQLLLADRVRREKLGVRARARAELFSWAETAAVLMGALEEAASGSR